MNFQKTLMSFDHYFGKMEGLVKDKKVPARVRFLIQDVIDLRKSNWIPRREKAGPKTLDQIHKEVEKDLIMIIIFVYMCTRIIVSFTKFSIFYCKIVKVLF